jgi:hypothetical protein
MKVEHYAFIMIFGCSAVGSVIGKYLGSETIGILVGCGVALFMVYRKKDLI